MSFVTAQSARARRSPCAHAPRGTATAGRSRPRSPPSRAARGARCRCCAPQQLGERGVDDRFVVAWREARTATAPTRAAAPRAAARAARWNDLVRRFGLRVLEHAQRQEERVDALLLDARAAPAPRCAAASGRAPRATASSAARRRCAARRAPRRRTGRTRARRAASSVSSAAHGPGPRQGPPAVRRPRGFSPAGRVARIASRARRATSSGTPRPGARRRRSVDTRVARKFSARFRFERSSSFRFHASMDAATRPST